MRVDERLGACVDPEESDEQQSGEGTEVVDAMLAVVPPCEGADLGPTRPATHGSDFWARTALPPAKPRTSPAEPITGRDAYLSVGAPLRVSRTQTTPLGPLTVTAVGTASVAWGDGTTSTARPGDAGGPYPSGHIRHVYENRGVHDLRVTITWRATWELAGSTGRLPQVRTTESIPIVVREIQAVITA